MRSIARILFHPVGGVIDDLERDDDRRGYERDESDAYVAAGGTR